MSSGVCMGALRRGYDVCHFVNLGVVSLSLDAVRIRGLRDEVSKLREFHLLGGYG